MDPTPPTNPDEKQPEPSIQDQLDELLTAIEKQEPGTLDPSLLPDGLQKEQQAADEAAPAPTPEASVSDAQDNVADALAQLEEALDTDEPAEDEQAPAEVLEEVLAEAEQTPTANPEADMLASLNAALQDLSPDREPSEDTSDEQLQTATLTDPPSEPESADQPTPLSKTDEQLQDEINALLNSEPDQAEKAEVSEPTAKPTTEKADVETEQATEQERIAEEIEGLLNANQDPAQQQAPTIDDLDQMLASGVELDDELDDDLLGDFQSVQDVTAGIQIEEPSESGSVDDEHAATARDVAAELDSQPELQPAGPDEDPLAALAEIANVAEKNQVEYEEQVAREEKAAQEDAAEEKKPIDWLEKLQTASDRALRACFILNWPARRFLSTEWRANLGYLALIHLFIGVAMWFYLIVR